MPIEIDGLAELSQLLTEETPKAAKRYLLRAGNAAADIVVDALEETVPVELGVLEEAIVKKTDWDSGDGETQLTIAIGPLRMAFWGMFQEFGTRFQQGQHWMARGWNDCKDRVLDKFATEAVGLMMDLENKK
ncbi:MAG: HK97-gp10 family putative phage morphogenesis protein [Candidatus Sulfotelmatobacter sp.]